MSVPERIWLTVFTDDRDPRFVMTNWRTPEVRNTQPGDYVATRPHRKIAYVPDLALDDGWVTFGHIKVDVENETETFERIDPAAASLPPPSRQSAVSPYCWVCRGHHELTANKCPAMAGIR